MRKHYSTCRTSNTPRHNVYLYRFIREDSSWNDWTYEILETILRTTIHQRKLKQHYIETLRATLNTYLPTRTDRERKINARRRARYAKQKQSQQEKATPVYFCLVSSFLVNQISDIKFRFKGEILMLRLQRINEDTVIGRVANHPANPGLLLNQLIGVPVKDVLDVWANSHLIRDHNHHQHT